MQTKVSEVSFEEVRRRSPFDKLSLQKGWSQTNQFSLFPIRLGNSYDSFNHYNSSQNNQFQHLYRNEGKTTEERLGQE